MTKETALTNMWCYFWAFNRRCEVIAVDSFGSELHYGFRTVDNSKPITGWIPVELVGQCELSK